MTTPKEKPAEGGPKKTKKGNQSLSTSPSQVNLAAALAHAAAGRLVFPCRPSKAPYTANGFKGAIARRGANPLVVGAVAGCADRAADWRGRTGRLCSTSTTTAAWTASRASPSCRMLTAGCRIPSRR